MRLVAGMNTAQARVLAILGERAGSTRLSVEVGGSVAVAISIHAFGPTPSVGEEVLVNTTAVDLGLGTGGVHLVLPSRAAVASLAGHAMKLRYTPLQVAVAAVEEGGSEPVTLSGAPVIAIALHSALIPVALGIRSVAPEARIAYVMTDAAALPLAFSEAVAAAVGAGLISATVTSGQAFGGDVEAVNLYSALCAAAARADFVICGMGPGNLGTGSPLGSASLEVGQIINAAAALGGRPVVAPRISFADPRERHRGLSHHTTTALEVVALAPAEIAVPLLPEDQMVAVTGALEGARDAKGHTITIVDIGLDVLEGAPHPLTSMGRTPGQDPAHFLATAAAGVLAARV